MSFSGWSCCPHHFVPVVFCSHDSVGKRREPWEVYLANVTANLNGPRVGVGGQGDTLCRPTKQRHQSHRSGLRCLQVAHFGVASLALKSFGIERNDERSIFDLEYR